MGETPNAGHEFCAGWESDSDESVYTSVSALIQAVSEPIVIRNHPSLSTWPALGGGGGDGPWSPESLGAVLPVLPQVASQEENSVFVYKNGDKPLLGTLWEVESLAETAYNVSSETLLGDMGPGGVEEGSGRPRFRFFTGPLQLDPEEPFAGGDMDTATVRFQAELIEGMSPFREFVSCAPLHPGGCAGDLEISANLWMGTANVTSQAHYDGSTNMYVQIHGVKTFYLAPPESEFPLFPRLHESYRSVSDEHVRADNMTLYARLEPGDLLLMPAYWYHHVVAETGSISANFWCDSWTVQTMWLSRSLPFPFEAEWLEHVDTRMVLSEMYAALVVGTYTGGDPGRTKDLLHGIYPDRYASLFDHATREVGLRRSCRVRHLDHVLGHHAFDTLTSLFVMPDSPESAGRESAFAELVAFMFEPFPDATPPPDLRWSKWAGRILGTAALARHALHGPRSTFGLAHEIFVDIPPMQLYGHEYALHPQVIAGLRELGGSGGVRGERVAYVELQHTMEEFFYAIMIPDGDVRTLAHTLPTFLERCL